MSDINWTILPEFDELHQNRYIIMVSERASADGVAKRFSSICSQPFELKNDKYSWGLYVDNSTRDERKNIYRFFLGETEGDRELEKEEEVKDVISELNNIFSTLTKAEQRHIKEEIPEKIEVIERLAEKKAEEKKTEEPVRNIPVVKEEEERPVTVQPQPVSAKKEAVPAPQEEITLSMPSVSLSPAAPAPVQDTPLPEKIQIERFGEPAAPAEVSAPEQKAAAPVIKPAPAAQPVPAAANVPPGESVRVGYLYPSNAPETLEKFIGQLKSVTEKSMKVPIYLEQVSSAGYDASSNNDFHSLVAAAKSKNADIILAVIPDGVDDIRLFIDTACRRNEILYMVAQQNQLDKKFLFVDMAIELLLIKKKLRS